MSDQSELKRLAEAVRDNDIDWEPNQKTYDYFQALRDPSVVLALIAENEALRKDADRYRWYKAASDFDREKLSALDGEDADAYVDAAIGSGDQSEIHHTSWALVHEPAPTCANCGVKMFTGITPQTLCNRCKHD